MKKSSYTFTIFFIAIAILTSISSGSMSIEVTLADSNEPIAGKNPNTLYVYPDMMAGTAITLTLISDKGLRFLC